jgi:glycosyltransferase involved in cell wall biosynthesis
MLKPLSQDNIRVCHVAVADLWAGAEVQLKCLIAELARMPDIDLSVVLFNGGRLQKELSHYGIPVQVFPEKHWNSIRIGMALRRYFGEKHFDIIHTHKYKDTILAAPIAHWSGVPHVVRTVHGLTEPFSGVNAWKMTVYESVERQVYQRYVSTLLAVSSEIECRLRQTGATDVACIRNGIELNTLPDRSMRSATRRALGVTDDVCLIGSVGRLTPVKGFPHLIKAVQLLREQGLNVKLWLVGDGILNQELRRLAQDSGVGERVVMFGPREDTYELLQAMDMFVLPSLHEGIPMALLEAMAAGLPVIATRVGGIPEVIEDRVSGILVEPGDPEGLALVCRRLMHDAVSAERLGQAARARVEERFSSGTMAADVANVYRRLVGHQHGHVERHDHQNIQTGIMVG